MPTAQQWNPFEDNQHAKSNGDRGAIMEDHYDATARSKAALSDNLSPFSNGGLEQIACPAAEETVESLPAKVC